MNFSFCYQFTRKVFSTHNLVKFMSGANTSASKSFKLLLFKSRFVKELKLYFRVECETRKVVKKFPQITNSSWCDFLFFLPQTNEILRAQITKVVAEQHELLQSPHLGEKIFGNFSERILTQMQLENFRETAESARVEALNFVCCEIQDNKIP